MAEKAEDSDGMLMDEVDLKVRYQHERSWLSGGKLVIFGLIALGVCLIIIGVILLALAHFANRECSGKGPEVPTTGQPTQQIPKRCEFSVEAQRVGLDEFLKKVKSTYFQLHPFSIPFHPDMNTDLLAGSERIKRDYEAYDPTPSVIKNRTDVSWALLEEITRKTEHVKMNALLPRERKSLAQVKHYLQHTFGQPYDVNYYAGDWMMGPNLFCWQPICYHGYDFYNAIIHHRPTNEADVKLIRSKLATHQRGILQYIDNMKMGVRKGMIRSREECVAGTDSLKRKYLNVSLYNETGIWKEWFVEPAIHPEFYSLIPVKVDQAWKKEHGKNINETIKDYLLTYLGKPLHQLIWYLENEYIHHCVPSNVSSGLGRLPLSHVWYDGVEDKNEPTNQTLPTGESLNGPKAYSLIMPYFTTNNMNASDVHDLGKKQLEKLYPLVVEIAKEMTGTNDSDLAVKLFRERLNSTESFFNDAPIPANESNKEAHKRCSDLTGAEKYCPKRWAAMQLWFKEARRVMSMLDPKTVDMFYFTGPKHTTPNCPVDLLPDLNPSSGAQSYENSDPQCSRNAIYNIPFFLENLGPRFSEWSVNAHEARPGHHTQVQGTIEHFQDGCSDALTWLDTETYYTAFTEGWALYAENPLIAEDTDTYDNEPMQKFGMLKWQIWRALRLIVDTGLHYYPNFTREDALWYFDKFAWDNTDLAQKEVTRYQSDPGQATAYMIGQLDIKSSRDFAKEKLQGNFSLRDFHYQVLAQGSSPLAYLKDHIERYVDCVQDNAKEGCAVILNAPKKASVAKRRVKGSRWPVIPRPHQHYL